MFKVKNWKNANEFPKNYEVNNSPSKTIPDQAYTLRELLDRYARGLPLGKGINTYDEDDDSPIGMSREEFQRLDLADQQEIIDFSKSEVEEFRRKQALAKTQQGADGKVEPDSKGAGSKEPAKVETVEPIPATPQ